MIITTSNLAVRLATIKSFVAPLMGLWADFLQVRDSDIALTVAADTLLVEDGDVEVEVGTIDYLLVSF